MSNLVKLVEDRIKGASGWEKSLPPTVNSVLWKKALLELVTKPLIQQASFGELVSCINKAVRDGLILDGREAAIVPHRRFDKVALTYMPMVAGLIKLLYSGGLVARITARCVYTKDELDISVTNDGESIIHKPCLDDDRGSFKGAYVICHLTDGNTQIRYMPKAEIDKRRDASKSKKDDPSNPWNMWYEEMAIKTVLHNLFKLIPTSVEVNQALLDSIDAPMQNMGEVVIAEDPEQAEEAPQVIAEEVGQTKTKALLKNLKD